MKIYGAARTVICWVLASLTIVFISPIAQIEVLRYFIGALMIFYGVEEVLLTVFKSKKHYSLRTLYWNIVEIVIGLTLIVFVETGDIEVTYAVVCVSWAIWSILRESREMYELTEGVKEHKPVLCRIVSIFDLLESLTVIALSLTMLIEPGEHHATIHLYLIAVELYTKALFPLINYLGIRLGERKREKGVQTESEPPVESEPVESEATDGEIAPCEEQQNTDIPEEK